MPRGLRNYMQKPRHVKKILLPQLFSETERRECRFLSAVRPSVRDAVGAGLPRVTIGALKHTCWASKSSAARNSREHRPLTYSGEPPTTEVDLGHPAGRVSAAHSEALWPNSGLPLRARSDLSTLTNLSLPSNYNLNHRTGSLITYSKGNKFQFPWNP